MQKLFQCICVALLFANAFGQTKKIQYNRTTVFVRDAGSYQNSSFAEAWKDAGIDKFSSESSLNFGTLIDTLYYSNLLEEWRTMYVYLPTCTDTTGCEGKSYPAVYFLHPSGFGEYGSNDLGLLAGIGSFQFDLLIAQGIIEPMIAVFPDGSEPHFGGSFYSNSELYGRFEDHIVNEVIAIVDSSFATRKNRRRRGIMGQSMGAYGAMKLALNNSDKYRAVASHSAPLDFTLLPFDSVLAEYGGPPFVYNPGAGQFSLLMFQMTGAFSPNPSESPYPVDLPLDSEGQLVDSVFNKWLEHTPTRLVRQITPNTELAIYFDVGTEDELGLFQGNEAFRDSLKDLGVDFDYRPYEGGGHFDPSVIVKRIREESIVFMDSVLSLSYGCSNTSGAIVPKQLAALDLDPSDLAIEYEDYIYAQYRKEIENIFVVLGENPQIQFDLYHLLRDSRPFINGTLRKEASRTKISFDDSKYSRVLSILNRIRSELTDPETKFFLQSIAETVSNPVRERTYEQLLESVFNNLPISFDENNIEGTRQDEAFPQKFHLEQNYPNPFNPTTTIRFTLNQRALVNLSIFNTVGQRITTLVDQELPPGVKSLTWDASGYASGVYLLRLRVDSTTQVRKIVLTQ